MSEKNEITVVAAERVTPMTLIEKAQAANASIEQMQQLFELQIRWEENEARKAYHLAVANFKAESLVILKDKKVGYTNKDGTFTGYSHSTLGNIVQTIVPIMSKHGLSHSWEPSQQGQDITVTCHLTHSMGHSTKVTLSAGKDDSGKKNLIQQVASTITYLERYTLLAITGLASSDQDDDGRGAQQPKEPTISEEQIDNIDALIQEVGADVQQFLVYIKATSIPEIPAKNYAFAVKALEAKRGKK